MIPDFRDEIRPILPTYLIGSGLAAESFIDGNNINCLIDF